MNTTIQSLLNHKTVRFYCDTPVPTDILNILFEVALRTATSNGMQQASIIHVKDISKREIIADVCKQKYVAQAPVLLMFVADQYRNHKIAHEVVSKASHCHDVDRFFQGYTDACLMAQSVVAAAESLGLGTTYLGAIHNDTQRIVDTLQLPQYTFPVVGLLIGYSNQDAALKPRLAANMRIFEDTYATFEQYVSKLEATDKATSHYIDARNPHQPLPAFSVQVSEKMNHVNPMRLKMGQCIIKQGFSFNLDE